MIEISGIIIAISPIHIGNGKSTGTFVPTLKYIPGRTLRGMLGYFLYKNDKNLFDSIGIDEEKDLSKMGIFFKNAYPMKENETTIASTLIYKWCKKCHSLFEKDREECKEPCFHEGKKEKGLILKSSFKDRKLKRPDISTQISTKCPIIRKSHTSPSEESKTKPYHVEAINPNTKFQFKIIVKNEFAEMVIESLRYAGIFYGIGGFRSRGYGNIRFEVTEKKDVNEIISEKTEDISKIKSKLLVANSQMILKNGKDSIIGFDDVFINYMKNTIDVFDGEFDINISEFKISKSMTGGWSLKKRNSLDEIIPCIAPGSCVEISGNPKTLAILELYGIGEMLNCGYGDIYIMESDL